MTPQFPTGQLDENKMQMDMCAETPRLFSLFHFPIRISRTGLSSYIEGLHEFWSKNKFI